MKLKTALSLVLALLILCLCGCAPKAPTGPETYDGEAAAGNREQRQIYLTLWSWQITSEEDARAYAQKAVENGFTAVDFGILWSSFEPLKGHFDWTYLDGVVKIFTDAGLKISVQPLLWTQNLQWANTLSLQRTADGKLFTVDGRGAFPCLNDGETVDVLKNTLQVFALHVSSTYGADLTRWGVRLSCFGEFDYSVNEELDYSEPALRAFYDYLKEEYGTWGKLADCTGLVIRTRTDLETLEPEDVVEACAGDWRRFRQETLWKFLDTVIGIFDGADETVPFLFGIGTYGNGMNAAYSGIVDLWSALNFEGVDIVGISACDGADLNMMLSAVTSLTTRKIALEVDGAWALAEGKDVKSQAALAGKYGLFSLSTANFTLEQLDTHKETLSSYPKAFLTEARLGSCDPTKGILIFSDALTEEDLPRSFDAIYGEIWDSLSEQGTRRVRFITDGQVASGDVSLEGVEKLYPGKINGKIPVSEKFAERFIRGTAVVVSGEISFVDLKHNLFEEDLANALAQRTVKE